MLCFSGRKRICKTPFSNPSSWFDLFYFSCKTVLFPPLVGLCVCVFTKYICLFALPYTDSEKLRGQKYIYLVFFVSWGDASYCVLWFFPTGISSSIPAVLLMPKIRTPCINGSLATIRMTQTTTLIDTRPRSKAPKTQAM